MKIIEKFEKSEMEWKIKYEAEKKQKRILGKLFKQTGDVLSHSFIRTKKREEKVEIYEYFFTVFCFS